MSASTVIAQEERGLRSSPATFFRMISHNSSGSFGTVSDVPVADIDLPAAIKCLSLPRQTSHLKASSGVLGGEQPTGGISRIFA